MDRPLLILDLDETLISSTKQRLDREEDFVCGDYFVYERPCLQDFLDAVSPGFTLAVWTSSTSAYASIIVERIFHDFELVFTWSRERCTWRNDLELNRHYWAKDLRKVRKMGYSLDRVLMVDNTPHKLRRNYGNLVTIESYYGSLADSELRALAKYLQGLINEPNFRSIEKRGWKNLVGEH